MTTTAANQALVRRLYGGLMAKGDTAVAEEVLAEDYLDHDILGVGQGGRQELVGRAGRLVADQLGERGRGGGLTGPNPTDRGKPASTYHLLVDRRGIPLAACLSAANTHDAMLLEQVVDAVAPVKGPRVGRVGRASARPSGRPRQRLLGVDRKTFAPTARSRPPSTPRAVPLRSPGVRTTG